MREGSPRKLSIAIALVLAVAASLWFASSAKALIIDATPPPDGMIGGAHNFSVVVTIEDAELLPIQHIDLYIYKTDNRAAYEATCADLPLADGLRHYPSSEAGGGDVDIVADADSAWRYS